MSERVEKEPAEDEEVLRTFRRHYEGKKEIYDELASEEYEDDGEKWLKESSQTQTEE